ncbi:hypothetical protein ABZY83_17300 [Streptomyces virginiae]|uniref:hypothetical protein n=1 Tax=Streptomyces virginiae TaxID=1961 RepID=UPI0033A63BC5
MGATPMNATVPLPELLTPRLRLRAAHDGDGTDLRVRAHPGGPRPRTAVEAYLSGTRRRARREP